MIVGFDIDEPIYPWMASAHALCEKAGITNGVLATTWYPYEEYGVEAAVWHEILSQGAIDGTLYDAEPHAESIEQIRRVKDAGHTVVLLTARGALQNGPLIRARTIRMIAEYKIPHDALFFTVHKSLARLDTMIDDHVKNYDELEDAGVYTFLLDMPHNQVQPSDGRFRIRVHSVEEYVDEILNWDRMHQWRHP